jgi:uncharacterized membrane protein
VNGVMQAVTVATAACCGVTGGVLFAFSSFVFPALRNLPATEAVLAMQAINLAAPRSWFMLPLLGSALGSVVTGLYAAFAGSGPGRALLLVGAVAGVSALAITAGYHVPHNDILAAVDAHGPTAAAQWQQFAPGWARWNHVRTATALLATVALLSGVWVRSAR